MHVRIKRGWELPESAATPEDVFHQRRSLAKAIAEYAFDPAQMPAIQAQFVRPGSEP